MDEIKRVNINTEYFLELLEADIRQKILTDFIKEHEYVTRDDILCILGLSSEGIKNER